MEFKTKTSDTLPTVVVLAKQFGETGKARLGQLSASLQLGREYHVHKRLKNNGYAHAGRR